MVTMVNTISTYISNTIRAIMLACVQTTAVLLQQETLNLASDLDIQNEQHDQESIIISHNIPKSQIIHLGRRYQ